MPPCYKFSVVKNGIMCIVMVCIGFNIGVLFSSESSYLMKNRFQQLASTLTRANFTTNTSTSAWRNDTCHTGIVVTVYYLYFKILLQIMLILFLVKQFAAPKRSNSGDNLHKF